MTEKLEIERGFIFMESAISNEQQLEQCASVEEFMKVVNRTTLSKNEYISLLINVYDDNDGYLIESDVYIVVYGSERSCLKLS